MTSLPSIGGSTSLLSVVLPFLGVIMAGLLGWSAARRSSIAPLQASLNDAFRTFMAEAQDEIAAKDARISELEAEILRMRGEARQLLAVREALLRILEKNNIMPPDGAHHGR